LKTLKESLYRILEPSPARERWGRTFDALILSLISLSVAAAILRTVDSIAESYGGYLQGVQLFATAVFTVEYLLRLYSVTTDSKYSRPVVGRIRFALTPMAVIDLLAVLPFYLLTFLPVADLAGSTLLFRMLRLLKLFRYSRSLTIFAEVLEERWRQLSATFFVTFVLLIVSSTLVYFAERAHNQRPSPRSPRPCGGG
jgi:voltage-gated potassium channel